MTISPCSPETMVPEHGLVTLSAQAWDEAKRRAHVIAPLAAQAVVPIAAAETAAEQLGVSTRFVYKLIRRYRTSGSLLSALAPPASHRRPGEDAAAPVCGAGHHPSD